MNKTLLGIIAIVVVLLGGVLIFFPKTSEAPGNSPVVTNSTPVPDAQGFTGKKLALHYYEFTKKDYDGLMNENQGALLYFYANWCPICKAQEPELLKAMNEGVSGEKVMFRVNYADSDTNQDEKDIAKAFAVTYQHTFVVVKSDQVIEVVNGHQTSEDLKKLFSKI